MAKSIMGVQSVSGYLINSVDYFTLFSNIDDVTSIAQSQIEIKQPFIASNIRSYISSNTAGSTSSIDLLQNSNATTVQVEHGINATGWRSNTTDSAAIDSGDSINFGSQASGGGTRNYTAFLFEANAVADIGISLMGINGQYSFSGTTTRYSSINGTLNNFDSTTSQGRIIKTNYSVQNLMTYVSSNTRTANTTVYFRVNNVDTNLSVIYTTGQTGQKESLDLQLVVSDDECGYKVVTATGTGTVSFIYVHSQFISENISNRYFELGCDYVPHTNLSNTRLGILGQIQTSATEANCEIDVPFDFIATNMYVDDNNATITFYLNGSPTALSLSAAGTDTDTVSITTGDNIRFNSNASGPGIIYGQITVQGYTVESGFKPQVTFIMQG